MSAAGATARNGMPDRIAIARLQILEIIWPPAFDTKQYAFEPLRHRVQLCQAASRKAGAAARYAGATPDCGWTDNHKIDCIRNEDKIISRQAMQALERPSCAVSLRPSSREQKTECRLATLRIRCIFLTCCFGGDLAQLWLCGPPGVLQA